MLTVRIMNEFMHGPIWILDADGMPLAPGALPIVEEDSSIQTLDGQAGVLFDSYYEFDGEGTCRFDEGRQKEDKERMLGLVAMIVSRLDQINDGTFVVDDLETPYLRKL